MICFMFLIKVHHVKCVQVDIGVLPFQFSEDDNSEISVESKIRGYLKYKSIWDNPSVGEV